MNEKILKLPAVMELTGLGRATVFSSVKSGNFPAPLKLTKRSTGWLQSEVDSWIAERRNARGV